MRTVRTMCAAMLLGLALTAFQSDASAQNRRTTGTSRSTSSTTSRTTTSRPAVSKSNDSKPKPSVARPARTATDVKPAATKPSSAKPSVTRPSVTKPSASKPSTARPSVTKPDKGSSTVSSTARPAKGNGTARPAPARPSVDRPAKEPVKVTRPGHRPGDRKPEPVKVRPDRGPDHRPRHPRDHDFMHYSAPRHFWAHDHHCYGYRVRVLPTHVHHYVHHGISYYCYNDIWYRPYGGYYVVCRPPFGTVLAANLIADMAWAAVRLSYYNTVLNTYSQINENNEYIAQQNAIIAQNNATIAAQNSAIAMNQAQAQAAYALANQLGLVQSYAAVGSEYFYQDGVFYAKDASGEYKVILPPAGALVETLPEDYDMITLSDGNEYYKVDETIYKVTIVDGKPYFEVLGQLYQ